jgi:hypothetical protein
VGRSAITAPVDALTLIHESGIGPQIFGVDRVDIHPVDCSYRNKPEQEGGNMGNHNVPLVIRIAGWLIVCWALFQAYWSYRAFALGDPVQGAVVGFTALLSLAFATAPYIVERAK